PAAERAACAEIRARLDQSEPARPAAHATDEELLRAIAEQPDDDGVRLVYADWLQERGDPRGEFIALQLAKRNREPSAEQERREAALWSKHHAKWLGDMARYIKMSDCTFERGFLVRCIVQYRAARDRDRAVGAAGWATVESVTNGDALLLHPVMRSLREVRGVSTRTAIALATTPPARGIETLHVNAYGYMETVYELGGVLATTQTLPALRVLELSVAREEDVLGAARAIQASPLGAQLARFTISLHGEPLDASTRDVTLIATLAGGPGARKLVVEANYRQSRWQYAFERDGDGYRRLRVARAHDTASVHGHSSEHDHMLEVIRALPRDLLLELRFEHIPDERARTRLREAAFAQRRLPEIQFVDDAH
ncbi:MAG: TIGR02996 domain-containing protein, partial [Deltaproteobacteria bacterium]|nr:TIGR02996 domain-containing protein [Deltaproteobacteria bacterium]